MPMASYFPETHGSFDRNSPGAELQCADHQYRHPAGCSSDADELSATGIVLFSPDGKAIVRKIVSNGSYVLQYQPIDGSATHLLIGPTHDDLDAFQWSPSGNLLAVLQLRKSSDVVLITDLAGKQPH